MNQVVFQSEPDTAAFDLYRDMYREGSTVEQGPGRFYAEVTALRLPRLLVFERRLRGVTHSRDIRRVARDGLDHVTLQLVLSGFLHVKVDDAVRVLGPGEIVMFDNTRPQQTWTAGVHSVSVAIPRDGLAPDIRHGRLRHGLVLGPNEAGELIRQVRLLQPGRDRVGTGMGTGTGEQEAWLLGALLGETLVRLDNPSRSNSPLLSGPRAYARVLAVLDRHIGDPRLSIADLAEESGVSRSALYRLFGPRGGVAEFIQRQRLLRFYRGLVEAGDEVTVRALAAQAGFVSTAHATRRFRETFGVTPRAARRNPRYGRLGGLANLAAGPTSTVFRPWFDELM